MRRIAIWGLACASIFIAAIAAHGQENTNRPILFVVPYTPGTTADMLARLLGTKIAQQWNVPVVVDNKVGASSIIGTEAVARASPDGHTFLFAATSHGTLPAINAKLPFDAIRSFTPVSLLGTGAMSLVVSSRFSANTVQEFIDLAKKQPGVINYASPGAGSSQHLAMELFKQEAGIDLLHVPYKGTGGSLSDLVAGHVQTGVVSVQSATALTQSNKLRMLAVMSRERIPSFPQVPTLKELGYSNMVVETWYGVMAPAGMPPAMVTRMNIELNQLLRLPDVKEAMAKQGLQPIGGKPEQLDNLLRNEIKLWTEVVSRGKITVE